MKKEKKKTKYEKEMYEKEVKDFEKKHCKDTAYIVNGKKYPKPKKKKPKRHKK